MLHGGDGRTVARSARRAEGRRPVFRSGTYLPQLPVRCSVSGEAAPAGVNTHRFGSLRRHARVSSRVARSPPRARPASAKGQYIKSVAVSATFGPGIKLDPVCFTKKQDRGSTLKTEQCFDTQMCRAIHENECNNICEVNSLVITSHKLIN